MISGITSMLKRVLSSVSKFLVTGISLAVIGTLVLKLVDIYKTHTPIFLKNDCFIYDVSKSAEYMSSEEILLGTGRVISNNPANGTMLVRTAISDALELDFVVRYSNLRKSGYIKMECSK